MFFDKVLTFRKMYVNNLLNSWYSYTIYAKFPTLFCMLIYQKFKQQDIHIISTLTNKLSMKTTLIFINVLKFGCIFIKASLFWILFVPND